MLPPEAFFTPGPSDPEIDRIFACAAPLAVPGAHAHHLWESAAWSPYLEGLTLAEVRRRDTAFHHLIRPHLAGLPDDFDAGTVARGRGIRQARQALHPLIGLLDRAAPNLAWRARQALR